MRSTSRKGQALLRGGVVLLFVFTVVGPAIAQTGPWRVRNWWHAPIGVTLAVNTTFLDFGEVVVGDSQDLAFMISNNGDQGLVVTIDMSGPPFSSDFDGYPFRLPAGASQTFTMRFSPTSSGRTFGIIRIKSGGGNAHVDLKGKALPPPLRSH